MIDKASISIWDRLFSLPVEYDCYQGELVTQEQIDALNVFLSHKEWIEASKSQVENYCRNQVLADDENCKKDNVFSYIIPESIFVKREHPHPRIALMCKYRYDLEHGLAIVFSTSGSVAVGSQDVIL